jgi:hypothetical protein
MKALYFPERTRQRLFAEVEQLTGVERAIAVRQWWFAAAPDAKAEDARLLLRAMADHLARAAGAPVARRSAQPVTPVPGP